MLTHKFTIAFEYFLESLKVPLRAEVEFDVRSEIFHINNFTSVSTGHRRVLPDITLIRVHQSWVHADSRKSSALSLAVGSAIEACHAENPDTGLMEVIAEA